MLEPVGRLVSCCPTGHRLEKDYHTHLFIMTELEDGDRELHFPSRYE
jgi:hypothetical protein